MRSERLQAITGGVALAAMIATPLNRRGGRARRLLSTVVVTGAFATSTLGTARRWGARRALLAAAATAVGTGAVERIGTRTGLPFGRYDYTPALRPQVAGVPMLVPLAWFAMAAPARETAHVALGERSSPIARVVGGAMALTAWDLFLDPQMVGEGYWRWARRGAYRGIPLGNYVGWFATGLGVMALLEAVLPVDRHLDDTTGGASDLVAEYGVMAVMETVGFAAFFRDRTVAAVGGAGMLPWVVFAAVGRLRR